MFPFNFNYWIVWPDNQPDKAVAGRGWLKKQWYLVGPMGFKAMWDQRRMLSYVCSKLPPDIHLVARSIQNVL